jgi:glycerophosphoryl diester phosphodiesterase
MSSRRVAAVAALAAGSFLTSALVGTSGSGTAHSASTPPVTATVPTAAVAATTVSTAKAAVAALPAAWVNFTTEIIAHRGDVSVATQNTPAALRAAFRNGAPAVEFDVVWSKDNQLVVLHDTDLGKNTRNCTGRSFQKTYAQLRKCLTKDGKPIPNPYEALMAVRDAGRKVYIHVKTPAGQGLGRTFMAAVNKYGLNRNGHAVFFSDKPAMLDELKRAGAANVGLIFFDRDAAWAWKSTYPILIPFQTPVTTAKVRAAQARGQMVIPVESRPLSLEQARVIGVDAMIVNHLAKAQATFR